jgi:hypothetical protein
MMIGKVLGPSGSTMNPVSMPLAPQMNAAARARQAAPRMRSEVI